MRTNDTSLLEVKDLTVSFPQRRATFNAVDEVSLTVSGRQTVGLVGESGSGKSSIARAVLGLVPVTSGEIHFCGAEITNAGRAERRGLSRNLQIVFQDPYGSLSPARTVGQTLAEPLVVHEQLASETVSARVVAMLERVGLDASAAARYPRQFSGGQRQRIAIARALMLSPKLVICDEPVSSLDLSIQAQVLNLLQNLQHELGVSYLFIAHDLSVVRYISQHVVVLYQGRVMEAGPSEAVYHEPMHPYTRALLEAAPVADPELQRRRRNRRVKPTDRAERPVANDGCPFITRCPFAIAQCTTRPRLEPTASGSVAACHRHEELPVWNDELRAASNT